MGTCHSWHLWHFKSPRKTLAFLASISPCRQLSSPHFYPFRWMEGRHSTCHTYICSDKYRTIKETTTYITTPTDHQSALLLWPRLMITSGAMYSIVPQNVFVVSSSKTDSLHRPKSVILMLPVLSSRIFSGLRSLYTMPNLKINYKFPPCSNMSFCANLSVTKY